MDEVWDSSSFGVDDEVEEEKAVGRIIF